MVVAVWLVAVRKHAKRRMIAVFSNNPFAFIVEPLVYWFAVANPRPGATFHLKINAFAVGNFKSDPWRTP